MAGVGSKPTVFFKIILRIALEAEKSHKLFFVGSNPSPATNLVQLQSLAEIVVNCKRWTLNVLQANLKKYNYGNMAKNKYMESPEKLYEYFQNYLEWCKLNPDTINIVTSKGEIKTLDQLRIISWEGFQEWLYENMEGNQLTHLEKYRYNENEAYNEYRGIITRIDNHIFDYLFRGAAIGRYK